MSNKFNEIAFGEKMFSHLYDIASELSKYKCKLQLENEYIDFGAVLSWAVKEIERLRAQNKSLTISIDNALHLCDDLKGMVNGNQ